MRKTIAIACTAALVAMAGPVAAGPPDESGVVVRITDDREGFGILLDDVNEFWVFSNITRESFCAWLGDEDGPPPLNASPDDVMFVMAADAEMLKVRGGGPTTLHAWAGEGPGDDPCVGSVAEPTLSGDVRVRVFDNDVPNEGRRANSFGERGVARVFDADGNAYHYSWSFHGLWNPDSTTFRVLREEFTLRSTG